MTTKQLEKIMFKSLQKQGFYMVYEMSLPRSYINKYHRERVDAISYETNGTYRCYELKVSKSDFHSDAKLSFVGHYNYFVMPYELYKEVKDEIPKEIGCYVATNNSFWCEKKPKKQELKCNVFDLHQSMLQALYREYQKYRKIINKNIK